MRFFKRRGTTDIQVRHRIDENGAVITEVVAHDVSREQHFARPFLEGGADPDVLSRDGDRITLRASNGTWVWDVVREDADWVVGRWPDRNGKRP